MKRYILYINIIIFLLITGLPVGVLEAQKWPDEEGKTTGNFLTGKVYDFERKWFLTDYVSEVKDVWVRLVHLDSGTIRELETQGDGCYSFSELPDGNYSLSILYKGNNPQILSIIKGEFRLEETIEVKSVDNRPAIVPVCVSLAEGNQLVRQADCPICPKPDFKEHKTQAFVAGKVFDFDGNWSIEEVKNDVEDLYVRIVNLQTGKAREENTTEDGCYSFKDVPEGQYTFSVVYKGKNPRMLEKIKGDHVLPDRVKVQSLENRPVVVAVCMVLEKDNKLKLLHECHVCLKSVPPIALYFLPGLAPALLLANEDDPLPGSTFEPEQ
jgi:hypothetical protein